MKRRKFLQSLAAVFTLPSATTTALSSATTAIPAAFAVPTQARFWAIYMSGLHGQCTPQALQTMLNIPEMDAKRYLGQLLSDGVIKPSPIVQNAATQILSPNNDWAYDKLKKRMNMKAQTKTKQMRASDMLDTHQDLHPETELSEEPFEIHQEETNTEDPHQTDAAHEPDKGQI